MSPFAFFCNPPAAIPLDASDNALFICVAFRLMAGSLSSAPADPVDIAISDTRFAPDVRFEAPGSRRLFWIVPPLIANGMVDNPIEMEEDAEEFSALIWYGLVAAERFEAVSVS